MNILVLTYKFPKNIYDPIVSGEVKNPFNFCMEIVRRGHNVKIITVDSDAFELNYKVGNIDVYVVKDFPAKGAIRYLVRAWRTRQAINAISSSFKPEFVHSHVSFCGLGFLFSKFKHVRLISTPHGTNIPEIKTELGLGFIDSLRKINSLVQMKLDSFVYHRSNALISVSEYQVAEMVEIYEVARRDVSVIYNGVPDYYRPAGQQDSGEYILFVGRAAKKKGLDMVLALSRIYHTLKFKVVLGTRRFQTVNDDLLHQLEGRENIELIWAVPESDLASYYRRAKALIVPSRGYESLPTVILEAIRCHVPVIATRAWGIPEVIMNDKLMFEENSIESIAESLNYAINVKIDFSVDYRIKRVETEVGKLLECIEQGANL